MKVVVTGVTGFIGQRLLQRLKEDRHQIHAIGRRAPAGSGFEFTAWDSKRDAPPEVLENTDAVVNLAGEPVSQRWNAEAKRRIRDSRVNSTRALVNAIGKIGRKPRVLVSASAVGYYGDRGDELLTEQSPPGQGFLPEVCIEWEREAARAADLGVRVALSRTGIVLGPGGGALKSMMPAFKAGVGGPIGSGEQWMPWIHLDDIVDLIRHALMNEQVTGPLNGVAPTPVTNREFAKALGAVLHRPAILPTPIFALRLIFGELASVMTGSQRISPEATLRSGFQFRYRDLKQALDNVVNQ